MHIYNGCHHFHDDTDPIFNLIIINMWELYKIKREIIGFNIVIL